MSIHPEIFKSQTGLRPLTPAQIHSHHHRQSHPGMVWIEGGNFRMGSDHHYLEEAPSHRTEVDGFWIDRLPVTNRDFGRFVAATGHVTAAERAPNAADYPDANPDMLVAAASVVFRKPDGPVDMGNHFNWWAYVPGADWRHPDGPGSSILERMDHPVVHVAYDDAAAYAAWTGKVLPTEAEWEFAARGGLDGADYAWGDTFRPEGRWMANVWQGAFPHEDKKEAGFGTTPVGAFPPNGYGLCDMIGNAWEWTADWYSAHYQQSGDCCGARERSRDASGVARKVMKGGSFLCAPNYCRRYRPAARMAQPVDTGTCHLGFRCVVRK